MNCKQLFVIRAHYKDISFPGNRHSRSKLWNSGNILNVIFVCGSQCVLTSEWLIPSNVYMWYRAEFLKRRQCNQRMIFSSQVVSSNSYRVKTVQQPTTKWKILQKVPEIIDIIIKHNWHKGCVRSDNRHRFCHTIYTLVAMPLICLVVLDQFPNHLACDALKWSIIDFCPLITGYGFRGGTTCEQLSDSLIWRVFIGWKVISIQFFDRKKCRKRAWFCVTNVCLPFLNHLVVLFWDPYESPNPPCWEPPC